MKMLIVCLFLMVSTSFAAVVKSTDAENNCTLFEVIPNDENGGFEMKPGQRLVSARSVYGLSLIEMEINFDDRSVMVWPTMNIVLGLNRPLLLTKAIIREANPNFTFLVNQLNRKINLFEKMCINDANEIMYANFFPVPEETKH